MRQMCSKRKVVVGRNKQTKNRAKTCVSSGAHLLAGLCSSLPFIWVISSSSCSPSFFCSPAHVRVADRLSLVSCRLREHPIDLSVWRGRECYGGRGLDGKRDAFDYPIESLSTAFNLLSELCVSGCERKVKEGRKHLRLPPSPPPQPPTAASQVAFRASQMRRGSTVEPRLPTAVIFQGTIRRQNGQNATFKIPYSINCAITAKGMAL